MGLSDGQDAGQSTFNDAFMSRNGTNTDTTAKVDLLNSDSDSITDLQSVVNQLLEDVAAVTFLPPTVQKFTSGTAQTYTRPTPAPLYLRVRMIGGGGGGGSSGSAAFGAASDGGTTSFGSSLLTAVGGVKGAQAQGGTGGAVTVNSPAIDAGSFVGGQGQGAGYAALTNEYTVGGMGASTPFAGGGGGSTAGAQNGQNAQANSGGGGGGAGLGTLASANTGAGGGAGGYIEAIIPSPSSSYTYTVGSGGGGGSLGTSGAAGGNGAAGVIIVEEHYQ